MPKGAEGKTGTSRLSGLGRHRWLFLVAAVLAVVAILILWQAVIQGQDRFWERIQSTGIWRVGMDPSFPPFEDLDDAGRPVGFDVDLAEAMAAQWGVQVQIESIGFDGLIDAVWASKVDGVVSALPLQPQFSEDVAFSQPYFEAGLVLVTAADRAGVSSVDELAGRSVAVEWGSEGDVQARALLRRFPDLRIVALETPAEALRAVVDGTSDAALVDRISALLFDGQQGSITIHPDPLVSDPYVIAMPLRAPILQQQVGDALDALQADGTLDALMERWFGRPDLAGTP